MIIDRITAVRVIRPRVVTMQTPVRRVPREEVYVVGSGERRLAEGTTGNILDVSYEELEVEFYSPGDLILSAQQWQARST